MTLAPAAILASPQSQPPLLIDVISFGYWYGEVQILSEVFIAANWTWHGKLDKVVDQLNVACLGSKTCLSTFTICIIKQAAEC